ncbi:hypothetical protein [Deinococcus roseus]|uniref:Uncharacterized protein n=1 Tax=Deinococcus roseus TaxID=392414 RepID=A0ABQ2D3H9_9DEIO|nr:hypothetical protein [Deinococcus roseus]GGJ44529.1 hypothetical protein GCM10008938_33400 [Deinococcus roseus]
MKNGYTKSEVSMKNSERVIDVGRSAGTMHRSPASLNFNPKHAHVIVLDTKNPVSLEAMVGQKDRA